MPNLMPFCTVYNDNKVNTTSSAESQFAANVSLKYIITTDVSAHQI